MATEPVVGVRWRECFASAASERAWWMRQRARTVRAACFAALCGHLDALATSGHPDASAAAGLLRSAPVDSPPLLQPAALRDGLASVVLWRAERQEALFSCHDVQLLVPTVASLLLRAVAAPPADAAPRHAAMTPTGAVPGTGPLGSVHWTSWR